MPVTKYKKHSSKPIRDLADKRARQLTTEGKAELQARLDNNRAHPIPDSYKLPHLKTLGDHVVWLLGEVEDPELLAEVEADFKTVIEYLSAVSWRLKLLRNYPAKTKPVHTGPLKALPTELAPWVQKAINASLKRRRDPNWKGANRRRRGLGS